MAASSIDKSKYYVGLDGLKELKTYVANNKGLLPDDLIFYTLEPQSDDGLLVWNFFDAYLEANNIATQPVEFPVFKYFSIKTTNKKKK